MSNINNMSESKLLSFENFNDYLNSGLNIPHQLSFVKNKDNRENSFMYSTLYCLTNIKLYMEHFSSSYGNIIPETAKEKYCNFLDLMNSINKNISESNKTCDDSTLEKIEKFKLSLGNELKDPRDLIRYILIDLMNCHKINTEIVKQNSYFFSSINQNYFGSYKNGVFSSYVSLDKSLIKSNEFKKDLNKDDKYNTIIKVPEIGYYYSTFIKFHLVKENKTYTLEECFKNYLNEIRNDYIINFEINKNIFNEKVYIEFPESIIILMYYGKEKEKENLKNYLYNFDDILDFTNADYVDNNIKFKKYFLSSMIVYKPPENKKLFYTYCRKDQNSNCIIYNSKDNDLRMMDRGFMLDKLKKEKIKKIDNGESYPFVLVYTAF